MLELTELKSHSEIDLEDKLQMLKESLWGVNKYQQLRKSDDKNYRAFMEVSGVCNITEATKNAYQLTDKLLMNPDF